MRIATLLCLMTAAIMVSAGEFDFKNSNFHLTFDTKGGMLTKLIHNKVDWNARGPRKHGNAFTDSRLGQTVAEKTQFHEDFGKLEYELVSWKSLKKSGEADITFSVIGTVYNWLRLNKTYKVRPGNTLEVVYELVNTGKTPQPISFSTRNYFYRSDRENIYWQPSVKGVKKLKQQTYMTFSKLPPQTYLAIGSEDNSGLLIEYPADSTAGLMNWFVKGRSASTEFFSDEQVLPAGGKRSFSIKLHFVKELNKFIAQKKFTARSVKGKIPAMVDQLNLQEDRSYKIRTIKKELPKDTKFFDINLKKQFKDSWRAVELPQGTPLDKIAVFQLKNGSPSFDRPVGYVLNGRELLLKVPGFNPKGSVSRSTLKNGIYTEKSGARRSFDASGFDCRIFYDRTDGLKLKEKAPAGGELICNGTFDTPDPKNPAIPAHHNFVANKNYFAEYLKTAGINGSPCLRGGELIMPLISEPGRIYNISFMVKNDGSDNMTRCYFTFFDAEGKRMGKYSKLLFSSKKSFEWQKVQKKVFAPEGSAMIVLSVTRSSKKSGKVLLDNVSVKAEPISCSKITPLERGRRELKEQWGVPLEYLEKFSLAAANPHKKWFHPAPAEKALDLLYLSFEHERGRLMIDKKVVVELASRMPMNIKVVPVLGKFISSTGIYGVHVVTFGKELCTYSAEMLKALPKAPKVVLITRLIPKRCGKDLEELLSSWQKQGTHFIVLSGTFFPKLQGKEVKAPVKFMLPEMKKIARNRAIRWYKKGKSYVICCETAARLNPLIPQGMDDTAARNRIVYVGRDYPWWEYQNLAKIQIMRYLSGTKLAAQFVSGNAREIVIKSAKAQTAALELEYNNMFRETKAVKNLKLSLKPGINKIPLPSAALPGGRGVANARLLDAKGKVIDAGAFVVDTPETVKIDVAFKYADRIFPQGKPLVFDLKLTAPPANGTVEVEVEDTFQRIIARKSLPAKAKQTVTLELPAPRTVLNNLIVRVKKNALPAAETICEFSSPAGPTDFTEFFATTWGFQRHLARHLELDGITSGSPYSLNTQDIYRSARYENLAASPMGLASFRNSRPYRGDRKTDPVRNPCFHDPQYLAKNTELLKTHYGKNNLLGYYDIRDFWSGDEQFLGSTVCFSKHCLKKFREMLKEEYKSIAALNKVWETDYSSFDDVMPKQLDELKNKENLAPWLDHKLFMAATFAWGQFRSHLTDLVKYNPHARMGASGTQSPGYSYDWVQYMKHCKVMSYYSGIQVKLIHDLGDNNILAGRWLTYCYADTDQESYCISPMWAGLLRGSNMAAFWPPTMTNGDGTPTRNVRFAKAAVDEFRSGYTKLWLSGTPAPQIALLYSQSSLYTAIATFGRSEWLNTQNSWLKLLDDMKYDCRFLDYEKVAVTGIPEQYKVVILPAAVAISDAQAKQLEAFVKRGGTLIADFAPGRYDGHGKRRSSPVMNRLFAPFNGPIDITYAQLPKLGGKFKVAEKGMPLMQEKTYGKGRTVNFNFSVSDYHFIQLGGTGGELATSQSADAKMQLAMRGIVKKQLERSGVKPGMSVLDSKGKELPCMALVRWDGPTGTVALYKNPQIPGSRGNLPPPNDVINRKKGHNITVKLPFKGHLYDIRNARYLGYGNTFKNLLVPGIANFISVQKNKVNALELKAPSSLKAGAKAEIRFTAKGAVGPQQFNIRLFDPAGKDQRPYRKNLRTANGSGSWDFQIPFNAAKGKWQLCVTHFNTGLKKMQTIEVK